MSKNYVKLANTDELAPGELVCITVGDKGILLVNSDGNFYATDEMCTHEDARLCTGFVKEGYVKCPLHGSRFKVTTGELLDGPSEEGVQQYAVKVEGEDILVGPA